MNNNYDLIIVGMGPSSVFCAYELIKLNSKKKILLIEKGHKIENRICPISKTGKCMKCKPICSIIGGFSGAGAFSDGKLLSYHLSSYNIDNNKVIRTAHDNEELKVLYKEFLKHPLSEKSIELLHTSYSDKSNLLSDK